MHPKQRPQAHMHHRGGSLLRTTGILEAYLHHRALANGYLDPAIDCESGSSEARSFGHSESYGKEGRQN
jgi:hypothetical protein